MKKFIKEFKDSFRDTAYDGRKVLNSEELIKAAQQMNYTLEDIAKLCNVSKTTVSNWGNINKKDKPTMTQVDPLMFDMGAGRVNLKVEELPESVREYPPFYSALPMAVLNLLCIGFVVYVFSVSCISEWGECKKLPWYKMPSYTSLKIRGAREEFDKWRNDAELIEEFYEWKADAKLVAEFKAWKEKRELNIDLQPQP